MIPDVVERARSPCRRQHEEGAGRIHRVAGDLRLLLREGIARELVNRLQNLRKETNLAVTDRIRVSLTADDELKEVLQHHQAHICTEILCTSMELVEGLATGTEIELTDTLKVFVELAKA